MKKIVILISLSILLVLAGCSVFAPSCKAESVDNRFVIHGAELGDGIRIIKDRDTGVEYLFYKAGRGSGLIKLEQ